MGKPRRLIPKAGQRRASAWARLARGRCNGDGNGSCCEYTARVLRCRFRSHSASLHLESNVPPVLTARVLVCPSLLGRCSLVVGAGLLLHAVAVLGFGVRIGIWRGAGTGLVGLGTEHLECLICPISPHVLWSSCRHSILHSALCFATRLPIALFALTHPSPRITCLLPLYCTRLISSIHPSTQPCRTIHPPIHLKTYTHPHTHTHTHKHFIHTPSAHTPTLTPRPRTSTRPALYPDYDKPHNLHL